MFASYLGVRVDHQADCPDVDPVRCATQDIPAHEHHQGIDWFRADAAAHLGLGRGWQLMLGLPLELRVLSIDYTTLDGTPYLPPYGNNHHRDEVLWGPGDGRAMLWRYVSVAPWLVVGAGVGSKLPLGRTEDDPFALAAQGFEHQHFQLGTGTFDPQGALRLVATGPRWGGWAALDTRVPLYASGRGYRAPRSLGASLGPTYRVLPQLQVVATVDGLHESPEKWDGQEYGGRQVLTGSLAALYSASPSLVLQAGGRATAWQRSLADAGDEPLKQGFIGTVGLSWTPRRTSSLPHSEPAP